MAGLLGQCVRRCRRLCLRPTPPDRQRAPNRPPPRHSRRTGAIRKFHLTEGEQHDHALRHVAIRQLPQGSLIVELSVVAISNPGRSICAGGEQRSAEYLQRNPFAQVPVLDDNGLIIRDSQAILVYLAKRYGGDQWWPDDAYGLAQIAAWLSTAANEIFHGPTKLRVHHKFGSNIDTATAQQTTEKMLGIVENHLESRDWLAGDTVSIADLAIYPYLALAPEGGIDIGAYRHIIAWFSVSAPCPAMSPCRACGRPELTRPIITE